MRHLPILLAAIAAFASTSAQAEMSEAQRAEMNCVYDALTEEQRMELVYILYGTDEEADAAEASVGPVLDTANDTCTARHGWDEQRQFAGEDYALFLSGFRAVYFSLEPELVTRLETLMAGLDADYAYTFTQEGQLFLEDYPRWAEQVRGLLTDAGVAEADQGFSISYLTALADVTMTEAQWELMFLQ